MTSNNKVTFISVQPAKGKTEKWEFQKLNYNLQASYRPLQNFLNPPAFKLTPVIRIASGALAPGRQTPCS